MSLEMTYSAGKQKHEWRFVNHEAEALEILASKGLKNEIDTIIGVDDFGEECHINRDKLYDAVTFIIKGIEKKTIPLPSLFDVKVEIPRGSGSYSVGGTAISGLKIKQEEYVIMHGLEKCVLIKKWQDADMKIHHGEPIDIRHLSTIKTDEDSFIGDAKITKRKMSNILVKNLNRLKTFLEGCTGDDIIKVLG